MAVELAKVSLWINSCVENMPLNFLDHHIKCGNSLIGASPELLKKGVPDEAFLPLNPNEKEISKKIRFRNSMQRNDRMITEFQSLRDQKHEAREFALLDNLNEKTTEDIEIKKKKYLQLTSSLDAKKRKDIADAWVATFFWSLNQGASEPPTQGSLRLMQNKGIESIEKNTAETIRELSAKYSFFHWHLEFPDIFESENKGFDCLIGNPPWDMIKENSDEFFSFYDENYRSLNSKEKKKLQKEICLTPSIQEKWSNYENYFAHITKYCVHSGVFTYQGTGHLNAFKLFLERACQIIGVTGRFGLLVPSGIYTDEGCTELRKFLFEKTKLEELFCFENRQKIFPIHSSFKFVILVAQKGGSTEKFAAGFMLHDLDVLPALRANGLKLPVSLVRSFSPDTLSVMEFVNQDEIYLMEKLYGKVPLLGTKLEGLWNVVFHRELNQTDDHELLQTNETPVRIFEGKMIHQFYHLYEAPRFWLFEKDALDFYARRGYQAWQEYRLAYRAVASSTNETTLIATIIPKNTGSVESLRILELYNLDQNNKLSKNINSNEQLFLTAIMNSFVVNYVTRRKVSANLSAFYIYQLPVPRGTSGTWFFDQLVPRAARLVCTTEEYSDFWGEVYKEEWNLLSKKDGGTSELDDWSKLGSKWYTSYGLQGWDETKHDIGKRAQIRCEMEALIAHLYKLTKEEVQYVLSTFPIVKEKTPWIIDGTLGEFTRLSKQLKT